MELSIVTTMYRSEAFVEEFYRRVRAEAESITPDHEIIFVDDGSPDGSLNIAKSLQEKDPRIKIIELSRNFGHHKAIMTGLSHAKGELVFLIDCDLEEDPRLLGRFYQELLKSSSDVVYGVQQSRKGGFWERTSGHIFFGLFNLLSYYPVVPNQLTSRLMRRKYVQSLVEHRDRELFLGGLCAITGFRQAPIVVSKGSRGSTSYTWRHRVSLLVNAVTSFSNKPLLFIFYLGMLISSISGIAALTLVVRRIFFQEYLTGWPSLIVSLWLLGGLIIFCLGIIGIYLAKIFMEVKRRPYTVVRNVYDRSAEADSNSGES
ncbi:MAG: glycosyltransferase family 2 protein [Desulfomonile tiedjei]|nr:glycosyltransferase family 2 protein [Desulfomonile tiedjei]